MAICFLFTQHLSEEGCLSLKLNQQGQIDAPLAQRSFAEIKTLQTSSQTYLVAPAEQFSFHKLPLPWLADKKARAAIPFALEDKLAQNFDTLHFAFDKNYYQNGEYLVVVADKTFLQELIKTFESFSLTFDILTIDWFALKANELAVLESSILVNDDSFQGALTEDLKPFYLEKTSGERTIYRFVDSNQSKLNFRSFNISDIKESSYIWLAQQLQRARPMNICQGELHHGSGQSKTRRLYQAAFGMSLLWLIAVITINAIKIHLLNEDIERVDAKIAVIYREFFPDAKQIINPKFRISQLIKSQHNAADSTFWSLLNKLGEILVGNEITVEQIRFQNQTLTITVATNNFGSLEDLQIKLQQNKVKVKQTQASTKDSQVVSTLELNL